MARLPGVVLLYVSSALGCAVGVGNESADTETEARQPAQDVPAARPQSAAAWSDPCNQVIVYHILGRTVVVPIACKEEVVDKGDPPPDGSKPRERARLKEKRPNY